MSSNATNGVALASAQKTLESAQQTARDLDAITSASEELSLAKQAAAASVSTAAVTVQKVDAIKEPVKNVQFYGAVADGKTINNAAFAKAVASGEVIFDTPGVYLLDGVNSYFRINRDRCVLRVLVSGVVLKIKPNNQSRSYVCYVSASDCDLDFGDARIEGDRDQHKFDPDPDGKWHEHGYGIFVNGLRNKVRGKWDTANPFGLAVVTNCTGDGIGVAGSGHDISGFVCTGNRRQGCSAFDCADTRIYNNTFEQTGPVVGVPDPVGLPGPFAGMDVEPDKGNVRGLKIFSNLFRFNRGSGLTIWVRSKVLSSIEVEVYGNTFQGNTNNVWAKDEASRARTITLTLCNNISANAKAHDFRIDQGTNATIGTSDKAKANTFDDLKAREDRWRQGVVNPEIGKYANAVVNSDGWNLYV